MTKQAEIDAITNFTNRLPKESYLRPWLEEILPQVRGDILNDFPVSPSLKSTRIEADKIIADTKAHCERVKAEAERQAQLAIDEAHREANRTRSNLFDNLRQCANTLGFQI
jgi:hypothetical protein